MPFTDTLKSYLTTLLMMGGQLNHLLQYYKGEILFESGTYKVVAQFPMVLDGKAIFMYQSDKKFTVDDVKKEALKHIHVPLMARKKGSLPDVRIEKVNIDIKEGDIVRYRYKEYNNVFIADKVESGYVYNGEWDFYYDEPEKESIIFCSKWEPEYGELCWFWDNKNNLTLRTFEEMYMGTFKPTGSVMGYRHCEPLIGTPPGPYRED